MITLKTIAKTMMAMMSLWTNVDASEVPVDGRHVAVLVRAGYVTDVRVNEDPLVATISVTSKFTQLHLDQSAQMVNDVCTWTSQLSRKHPDEPAIGFCDVVLTGTSNRLGGVSFGVDGKAVTQWEEWYQRAKSR